MNTNNMFDVETIDQEFDIFWETLKSNFTIPANPKTGQSAKVKIVNGVEKLIINRKKSGVFIDEKHNKSVIRERFFVVKTGYYPNGVKATETNKKSMTVFKSVYKQYEMYFNTPVFTPADMFEMKKTLTTIKKLVANS
jgi:predicted Rdx family selenoprotein